jgi:hypothetical protein
MVALLYSQRAEPSYWNVLSQTAMNRFGVYRHPIRFDNQALGSQKIICMFARSDCSGGAQQKCYISIPCAKHANANRTCNAICMFRSHRCFCITVVFYGNLLFYCNLFAVTLGVLRWPSNARHTAFKPVLTLTA